MSTRAVSPHSATIRPRWRTSPFGAPRGATSPMISFHGGGSEGGRVEAGFARRGAAPFLAMRRWDVCFAHDDKFSSGLSPAMPIYPVIGGNPRHGRVRLASMGQIATSWDQGYGFVQSDALGGGPVHHPDHLRRRQAAPRHG